jgi:hypothetical protein
MNKQLYSLLLILYNINISAQSFHWAKGIGSKGDESGNSLVVDKWGNSYTTGKFEGTMDFDPGIGTFNLTSQGESDIFILKLDASGNFLWAKRIGGIVNDIGKSIAVDNSGNVYISGSFSGEVDFDPSAGIFMLFPRNSGNLFLLKLDALGNFKWAKTNNTFNKDLALDINDNVYITGVFSGMVDFNPSLDTFYLTSKGNDIYVLKLDSSGKFIFAKSFIGVENNYNGVSSISIDKFENIYTTGIFGDTVDFDPGSGIYNLVSNNTKDVFVSKLDANGNLKWVKSIEGSKNIYSSDLVVNNSGDVYLTGYFNEKADFNPDKDSFNLFSNGGMDIFVTKLNSSGNFIWAKSMGGEEYDYGNSIAIDVSDNVYTTGFFSNIVDFDPGLGVSELSVVGLVNYSDAFISKLDSLGNFSWATQIGSYTYDQGNCISTDGLGNIYTTGYFGGVVQLGEGWNNIELTSSGLSDIFISKLRPKSADVNEIKYESPFSAFPNPSENIININIQKELLGSSFFIINTIGQVVSSGQLKSQNTSVDLSTLPPSLYLINIEGKLTSSLKIIKL